MATNGESDDAVDRAPSSGGMDRRVLRTSVFPEKTENSHGVPESIQNLFSNGTSAKYPRSAPGSLGWIGISVLNSRFPFRAMTTAFALSGTSFFSSAFFRRSAASSLPQSGFKLLFFFMIHVSLSTQS